MHARNRTWLLGSDPVERCRQRTLPVEGGDGSTLSLDFTTGVLDPRLTFTRSTTGTFTNASGLVASAAINTPRFDYDPTTRQPRGLLIEGSATNLAFWSENINPNAAPQNVYWTVSGTGASVTPTSQTDPANGTSASRCILGTSAVGRVYQGITTTAGITYTLSFWAKSVSGTTSLAIWHFNSATGNSTALTVGTSWTRYQVTILGRTGGGFVECGIVNLTSNAATVDLWGLQLETGSGASSYIPTGASTGNRGQDLVSVTLTNFSSWWTSNNPASFLLDFSSTQRPSTNRIIRIADSGGSAFGYSVYFNSSTMPQQVRAVLSSASSSDISIGTNLAANTRTKVGFTIETAALKRFRDGSLASTLSSPSLPPDTMTQMYIGGNPTFGNSSADFCLRSFKYWPTTLADATMQILTT
jgi:hypothetical protein